MGGARARGGCKGFGSGGVSGSNVCRIFVVSNAYKKKKNGLTDRPDTIHTTKSSGVSLGALTVGPICVLGGCGSPSIITPSTIAGGASKIWG